MRNERKLGELGSRAASCATCWLDDSTRIVSQGRDVSRLSVSPTFRDSLGVHYRSLLSEPACASHRVLSKPRSRLSGCRIPCAFARVRASVYKSNPLKPFCALGSAFHSSPDKLFVLADETSCGREPNLPALSVANVSQGQASKVNCGSELQLRHKKRREAHSACAGSPAQAFEVASGFRVGTYILEICTHRAAWRGASPLTDHALSGVEGSQITEFLIDTLPIRIMLKSLACNIGAHSNRHSPEPCPA
jgi:hypothetical protein